MSRLIESVCGRLRSQEYNIRGEKNPPSTCTNRRAHRNSVFIGLIWSPVVAFRNFPHEQFKLHPGATGAADYLEKRDGVPRGWRGAAGPRPDPGIDAINRGKTECFRETRAAGSPGPLARVVVRDVRRCVTGQAGDVEQPARSNQRLTNPGRRQGSYRPPSCRVRQRSPDP